MEDEACRAARAAEAERMAASDLRRERNGAVAVIVLAQPERQNATATAMWRALALPCDKLERDPAVRVVIVRGEGRTAFLAKRPSRFA